MRKSSARLAFTHAPGSFQSGSNAVTPAVDQVLLAQRRIAGEFLYDLTDGLHVINGFRIAADGSLTLAATSTVGHPSSAFKFPRWLRIARR